MFHRNLTLAAAIVSTGLALPAYGQTSPDPAAFVKKWDRSGKGLLDLKTVLNAAIVKFELLDKKHEGHLTQPALSQELSPEEFREANPDGDTTIGASEWFSLVTRRFKAANPDHDGSISADELSTVSGKALLKLVQ